MRAPVWERAPEELPRPRAAVLEHRDQAAAAGASGDEIRHSVATATQVFQTLEVLTRQVYPLSRGNTQQGQFVMGLAAHRGKIPDFQNLVPVGP